MRIAFALESHRDVINKLLKDNLEQSAYEVYLQELLDDYFCENEKYILICDEFIGYVGFVLFSKNFEEECILLDGIIIDKNYLNQGYEERLLYYVLKYAKNWGINSVKINANINNPLIERNVVDAGFNCAVDDRNILMLKHEKD